MIKQNVTLYRSLVRVYTISVSSQAAHQYDSHSEAPEFHNLGNKLL